MWRSDADACRSAAAAPAQRLEPPVKSEDSLQPGPEVRDHDEDTTSSTGAHAEAAPAPARALSRKERRELDRRNQSRGRRMGGLAGEFVFVIVGALLISAVLRAFVAQMFIIPSTSMTNTLLVNDRVMVSKVSDFHRGDIVVFKDPGGWLVGETSAPHTGYKKVLEQVGVLPSSSNDHLIKRVIGMPGDDVKCCDAQGRMSVNGVALDEKSYLYTDPSGTQVKPSEIPFEVIVPADHIFVMGDHRNDSDDSRYHLCDVTTGPTGSNAFVPESDVVGPALAIAAPINRWRHLTVPSTFASIPSPSGTPPAQAKVVTSPGCS